MLPVAFAAFAYWFFLNDGVGEVAKAVTSIKNGARVGPATSCPPRGTIPVAPAILAQQAGLDIEVYSLARMASSEHGNDPDEYIRAICWAVRNSAGYQPNGVAITVKVTRRSGSVLSGFYGDQATKPIAYVSTMFDPRERHVRIAREVLALPKSADPTLGATNFYSPKAQDALHARDPKVWTKNAAQVDVDWRKTGLASVVVAGVDSRRLTLYRKAA